MRIAVTGHMDISTDSVDLIHNALLARIQEVKKSEPLIGISCLARGADSIFAEAVLEVGGHLEVVLPSRNYRDRKVKPDHAPTFDWLIARAEHVRTLPFEQADKDAYEAANEALINDCDSLIAVWDGNAGKRSGTSTVVKEAESRNVPTVIVWPSGARRG